VVLQDKYSKWQDDSKDEGTRGSSGRQTSSLWPVTAWVPRKLMVSNYMLRWSKRTAFTPTYT